MHTSTIHTTRRRRVGLVAACLVAAVSLSACGDDEESTTRSDATTAAEAPEQTTATEAPADTAVAGDEPAAGETIVVTAVDYGFEGLPETVPVGTKISLANKGVEPHELVAMWDPLESTCRHASLSIL